MRRFLIKLVVGWLKGANLSLDERLVLSQAVLENLGGAPLADIISIDDSGSLVIKGRSLEADVWLKLRDSARGAKASTAFNLVREQVLYEAIKLGVHKADNSNQMFFARAAIWWGQQEEKYLSLLAQENQETTPIS